MQHKCYVSRCQCTTNSSFAFWNFMISFFSNIFYPWLVESVNTESMDMKEYTCSVPSHAPLFVTPWPVAHQAPLSMGFSRQEYWSGLPCPPPGDLPHPGIEPRSPASQVDSLPPCHLGRPRRRTDCNWESQEHSGRHFDPFFSQWLFPASEYLWIHQLSGPCHINLLKGISPQDSHKKSGSCWHLLTFICASVVVLAAQSCPTLCDPMDCSPPVSSVHGILQARILEWVAIPFSRVDLYYKAQMCWLVFSAVGLWETIAYLTFRLHHASTSCITCWNFGSVLTPGGEMILSSPSPCSEFVSTSFL